MNQTESKGYVIVVLDRRGPVCAWKNSLIAGNPSPELAGALAIGEDEKYADC